MQDEVFAYLQGKKKVPLSVIDMMQKLSREHGRAVSLYRDYAQGRPRSYLTEKQRRLLNLRSYTSETATLYADYLNLVINTLSDRLIVQQIAVDNDEAGQEWVDDFLERLQFNRLQSQVHRAAILYGDTYLVGAHKEDEGAVLRLDMPFDGKYGIIPFYALDDVNTLSYAAKIAPGLMIGDYAVYLYGKDEIIQLHLEATDAEGELEKAYHIIDEGENMWEPGVIDVVPFRYDHDGFSPYGRSEALDFIPLQDACNRNIMSMLISGQLSAFQVIFSKGFEDDKISKQIEPGAWYNAETDDPDLLRAMDMKAIAPGSQTEFIATGQFIVQTMMDVSRVAIVSRMTTQLSGAGEAIKQVEAGMLSKARRTQNELGACWERAIMLAHAIETEYEKGENKPPPIEKVRCVWRDPEIRSDKEVTEIAQLDHAVIGNRKLYVEEVGPMRQWTAEKQEEILEEAEEKESQRIEGATRLFDTEPRREEIRRPLRPPPEPPLQNNSIFEEPTLRREL